MSARSLVAVAREAALLELALYRSLVRWVARRPDVPRGTVPLGYARLVGPVLWLWILGSATEVVVVEVVLRQLGVGWADALRVPLLAVGVWGVLWMLGMLASYRVRPHLLTHDRLVVRSGARTRVEVPLDAVAAARAVERALPSTLRSLHHDRDLLLVGVSGRTNLEVTLTGTTVLRTSTGGLAARRVGLWADDPREVARRLERAERRP